LVTVDQATECCVAWPSRVAAAAICTRFFVFALVVISTALTAYTGAWARDIPQFAAYPASPTYRGKNAEPRLSTQEARTFRTRLREAAKETPNFAGRYILTTWGCGSSCVMGAVIDAQSGQVTFLPATVSGWGAVDAEFRPVEARLTSRLIVLSGLLDEKGEMGSHYFVFDGRSFTHLKTIKTSDDFGASKRKGRRDAE
jgi:hypothetical protein